MQKCQLVVSTVGRRAGRTSTALIGGVATIGTTVEAIEWLAQSVGHVLSAAVFGLVANEAIILPGLARREIFIECAIRALWKSRKRHPTYLDGEWGAAARVGIRSIEAKTARACRPCELHRDAFLIELALFVGQTRIAGVFRARLSICAPIGDGVAREFATGIALVRRALDARADFANRRVEKAHAVIRARASHAKTGFTDGGVGIAVEVGFALDATHSLRAIFAAFKEAFGACDSTLVIDADGRAIGVRKTPGTGRATILGIIVGYAYPVAAMEACDAFTRAVRADCIRSALTIEFANKAIARARIARQVATDAGIDTTIGRGQISGCIDRVVHVNRYVGTNIQLDADEDTLLLRANLAHETIRVIEARFALGIATHERECEQDGGYTPPQTDTP